MGSEIEFKVGDIILQIGEQVRWVVKSVSITHFGPRYYLEVIQNRYGRLPPGVPPMRFLDIDTAKTHYVKVGNWDLVYNKEVVGYYG